MKYSAEDKARVIREAREAIAAVDAKHAARLAQTSPDISPDETNMRVRYEPRIETVSERHRRELVERDAQWEIERARERAAQERLERERNAAAVAAADQRIADLEIEVIELAKGCNAVTDALEAELAHVTSENVELKVAQAKLETRVAELQLKIIEADHDKVIDLPPLRAVK